MNTTSLLPDTPGPEAQQDRVRGNLRAVFDHQIPNYGSFNVAYAMGSAGSGGPCLVGFQTQPLELVVAPIGAETHQATEPAVSINLTNVGGMGMIAENSIEIGITTGRTYRFACDPFPAVMLPSEEAGTEASSIILDQESEAGEFVEFVSSFLDALEAGSVEAVTDQALSQGGGGNSTGAGPGFGYSALAS